MSDDDLLPTALWIIVSTPRPRRSKTRHACATPPPAEFAAGTVIRCAHCGATWRLDRRRVGGDIDPREPSHSTEWVRESVVRCCSRYLRRGRR